MEEGENRMFKMYEIREIIKLFDETSLHELELEEGQKRIFLKKNGGKNTTTRNDFAFAELAAGQPVPQPVPVPDAPVVKEMAKPQAQPVVKQKAVQAEGKKIAENPDMNVSKIVAPMVGTFYRAPAEDAAPFVKPGDRVDKSTVVCILEAMKLFNEIEAEINGVIVEVLVENGQLVEHGQPLFLVKPE
jgi:acetyl-CoA carboxylase biotin carboxyl carrier protein